MKITSLHSRIALSLFSALLIVPSLFAAPFQASAQQYVPGEVLVKFKPATSVQTSMSTVQALGGGIHARLPANLAHIKLAAGQTVETALTAYRNDPNVEYAQPNYIYHVAAVAFPSDPNYSQQWPFNNTGQLINPVAPATTTPYATTSTAGNDMNMVLAWKQITDCSSVVVAVVDSGVNYNHQRFGCQHVGRQCQSRR